MNITDVIIVGSGVAALQLARQLSGDTNVIMITKSSLHHGNSSLAQGGIAAAIREEDHPFFHYMDTLEAGRSMNDTRSTLLLTQEAPPLIQDLLHDGCSFDYDEEGTLALGKEGAHSQHRIVHGGGDQTGKVLVECLKAHLPSNVITLEHHYVFELLIDEDERCYGVKSKNREGHVYTFHAPHVVLSTGGCGQIYSPTSNASTVTGDGIAMAYLAGAEIADMEFIQFHPTLLATPEKTQGLISEAVRGEGAILVDEMDFPIMKDVHPMRDLAPRHIVAQTIFHHRQQGHHVYLDIRMIRDFRKKFPSISTLCDRNLIDLDDGKIPVAPGCHFSMGGVKTDDHGQTSVSGLYAIGEVACTGVHGANRLASNSLLEGLVFGKRLAHFINEKDRSFHPHPPMAKQAPPIHMEWPTKTEIKERMMKYVGIVRTKNLLLQQLKWLEAYQLEKWENRDLTLLTIEQKVIVFMMQTAWLITKSALEREESRGGHFRADFPEEESAWQSRQIVQQSTYKKGYTNEPIETQA